MARPKKVEYYQAKESFVTHMGDEQISVSAGERVRAGHPLLKGRESLFKPAEPGRFEMADDEPEAATAAPGEKREAVKAAEKTVVAAKATVAAVEKK